MLKMQAETMGYLLCNLSMGDVALPFWLAAQTLVLDSQILMNLSYEGQN